MPLLVQFVVQFLARMEKKADNMGNVSVIRHVSCSKASAVKTDYDNMQIVCLLLAIFCETK